MLEKAEKGEEEPEEEPALMETSRVSAQTPLSPSAASAAAMTYCDTDDEMVCASATEHAPSESEVGIPMASDDQAVQIRIPEHVPRVEETEKGEQEPT